MGIVSLNIIKSWFKTGLIPTEAQFHDTWDSFHHKEEKIPVQDIQGIDELLDTKADKEVLEDHLINPDAHKELLDVKLDKVDFDATVQNLDDRLLAIENPDAVLKYGDLILAGLELTILPNAFEWVLDKQKYMHPDQYTNTLSAATAGMYRTDIVVGNLSAGYDIIEGEEASNGAAAAEPSAPDGTIKLGFIAVFGNAVVGSGDSEGDLLKGEIHLPAYPNTRNDGQLPTNRVLGTDANGHLKMYTIATAPAPFLNELIPDSYLPNNTGNFILKGSFFTPTMTVEIQGQTVNYVNFISDNEVHANVSTGPTEGNFSLTLNNGLAATFKNALLIVLGDVYSPVEAEWNGITGNPDLSQKGAFAITTYNSPATAQWTKELDITKNFSVRFNIALSPLGAGDVGIHGYQYPQIIISNSALSFAIAPKGSINTECIVMSYANSSGWDENMLGNIIPSTLDQYRIYYESKNLEWRFISGIMYLYENNILKRTYTDVISQNLKLNIQSKWFDFINLKYIELK